MTVVLVLQAKVEWTTVPVVVKIYKLLINEMSNQIEHSQSAHTGEEEEEVSVAKVTICVSHSSYSLPFIQIKLTTCYPYDEYVRIS